MVRLNPRNLEKFANYKSREHKEKEGEIEQINIDFDDLDRIIQLNNDPLYQSLLAKD